MCVSISFLVVFLGILIFIGLLIGMGFDYSGINGMGLDENMPYGIFLYQKPFLYVCCIVSIYAASMAVWVMSGLMISSYIPNSFVAICSPLIFSYLLEEITGLYRHILICICWRKQVMYWGKMQRIAICIRYSYLQYLY